MRLIETIELTPDMELATPIYRSDMTILLQEKCKTLYTYKKRLLDLGIERVYICDEISEGIQINNPIMEQTRSSSKKIIHDTLNALTKGQKMNIGGIKNTLTNIIDDIVSNKTVLMNLTDVKTNDTYTFSHSVNVAVISLVIGKVLGYTNDKLVNLGMGAILHDIGKSLVPGKILNKAGKLTEEEFNMIKLHPKLGYEIAKEYHELSATCRNVILCHHEKFDGTGYPHSQQGQEIHEFSRIVAIADVFDALSSDRCYRKAWSTPKVADFLMSQSGSHFDTKLLQIFLNNISLYPNGDLVNLSTGEIAIVIAQNKSMSSRPIVQVIDVDGDKKTPTKKIYNLAEKLSIVIIPTEDVSQ